MVIGIGDNPTCLDMKIIKDKSVQFKLIKEYHDSPIGGHQGVRKTMLRSQQKYIWKKKSKMIKNFIKNCDSCLRNKQHRKLKAQMRITDTPDNTFEVVSIDTVGLFRLSNNYRYILTMQCDLSKYIIA